MNTDEIKILTERLIPVPKKIKFKDGSVYQLRNGCSVVLSGPAATRKTVVTLFKSYWQIVPGITVKESSVSGKLSSEAYRIKVTGTVLEITAASLAGLMNAMKTLRQLAEVDRGTEKLAGYSLVQCEISDEPAMEFRGIHLCVFPETPLWDIEKQIRLAAYHKFNYAVIETWGVFPFESHPEFCWSDRKIDRKELMRLIRLGKELGITLIPELNLLGHGAASRSITGKHAILDYHPELQPLFEPEGWTWCISNPNVRRILTDLVTELYEFYDRPPFFHIGCDEADNIGTCRECRHYVLKDLVRDHILYFHDLFQKKGARIIMWHDMLLEKGDPRWNGYIVCGLPEHQLNRLYRELPRDIVIADWQYHYKAKPEDPEPEWPTAKFFKKEKFTVVVCPWLIEDGTISLGKMAAREKLFGMLETSWNIWHDRNYVTIFSVPACSAWNPDMPIKTSITSRLVTAHHVRQICWDMKLSEYEKTGFSQYQVDPGHHPHQIY